MDDINLKKKIALQILYLWKNKKNKYEILRSHINNLYRYIFEMMSAFHNNYTRGYILQENYNDNMERVEEIKGKYLSLLNIFNEKKITDVYNYYDNLLSEYEIIFHKILDMQKIIGTQSIYTILHNELGIKYSNLPINIDKDLLDLYNTFYNCMGYSIYNIDENYNIIDNSQSIVTYNIFSKKEEDTFDKKIIDSININNNQIICVAQDNSNNTSLIEKISGGKIFLTFPEIGKIIVLNGIFSDDPLNISFTHKMLINKNRDLEKCIEISPINSISFKESFLKQLSLRDLICYNNIELVNLCIKKYSELKKLKSKTITSLVKEFLSSDNYIQRDILSLFLMCEEDTETQYLAYLMYDMISCESYLMKPQLCHENVYVSLHWSLKKNFKCAITNINNHQQDIEPDIEIPYEKRILLMKCNENVKSKAMEKLKEIQSKNGENCVKAQQYLDGLLKIPFQIFIREPILCFLEDFKLKVLSEINYINSLKDNTSEIIEIKKQGELLKNKDITSYEINDYLLKIENIINKYNVDTDYQFDYNDIMDKIDTFNTKNACYNFIKDIKNMLTNDDIKILENNSSDLIFKSKIKTSNYSLFDIKNLLNNFFSQDLNKLNKDTLDNIINHLNIPLNVKHIDNSICLLDEKKNILKSEWDKYLEDKKIYLTDVKKSLDSAVYGHEEAKISVSRVIAQWANGEQKGYCFGFQGPPGCGKTSLAKQGLTKCLKDEEGNPRPFAFIPLGGSCNGSTLEGHNYTYVGSTWGRIVDILMECKCMNPIIFIDELDKVSESVHGKEITGILTHLTDASQNDGFSDKYFSGVDIDLSKCLIIFSYNDVTKVDKILLDRIHEINFKATTLQEKIIIAKNYMIPELCQVVGFRDEIVINDKIIKFIIETYTLEAGCRKLKEKLMEILRDINLRYQLGEKIDGQEITFPFTVTEKYLVEDLFVDKPKITIKKILPAPRCGLVNGLYATQAGMGGITIIECFKIPSESKLRLELTGQQGDVMKESMSVAKTVAYNILPIESKKKIHTEWKEDGPFGFHIHCPEGATPKDGPSAGAAITTCIYSVMTGIPVKNDIGITGEIDLNGRIHAIGGLPSKVQGAKSAGCKMVLCPEENKNDVEQILKDEYSPCDKDFTIKMVSNIWEVIDILLVKNDLKPLDYTGPQLDSHKLI